MQSDTSIENDLVEVSLCLGFAFRIRVFKGFENMVKNSGVTTSKIEFCDLLCKQADFARMEALEGSCRTFQSLWCKKLRKHVTKNAPCEVAFGKRRPTTGF
jgi:hypothetical protein